MKKNVLSLLVSSLSICFTAYAQGNTPTEYIQHENIHSGYIQPEYTQDQLFDMRGPADNIVTLAELEMALLRDSEMQDEHTGKNKPEAGRLHQIYPRNSPPVPMYPGKTLSQAVQDAGKYTEQADESTARAKKSEMAVNEHSETAKKFADHAENVVAEVAIDSLSLRVMSERIIETQVQEEQRLTETVLTVKKLENDIEPFDLTKEIALANKKKLNTTTNIANANTGSIEKYAGKLDKNITDILKNRQDLRSLENELRETSERLNNGLAASAALNGLFQPYGVGKLNITAAMGGYLSTQALAMGTGYRFNENIAVKTGVAYTGSNDVMYNMAVNLEW